MKRMPSVTAMAVALLAWGAAGGFAQESEDTPGCWVRGERADLELRASPYDSATVAVEGGALKVCYSRPRKLNRPIMGRLVPYGEPWRLGANEATAIHVPAPATIAGVPVGPGWHSLYAVPDEREWRIVVNANVQRWGIPINAGVREADEGIGTVPVLGTEEEVDLMTMDFHRTSPSAADLVLEWDRTAVRIPIRLDADAQVRKDRGAP